MKRTSWLMLGAIVLLSYFTYNLYATVKNGFILEDTLIPKDKILSGGPGKDGIPAIDTPEFTRTPDFLFLNEKSRVIGVIHKGVAKAYPINILNWHEIVNDDFAGDPVIVTYCPLCGSGVVYSGMVNGKKTSFGVSGLLYNSDVLLYDRETDSLWSQMMHQAVSGSAKGTRLEQIPSSHTTWGEWLKRHPDTLVLTTNTGVSRDYNRNPYEGYEFMNRIFFPVDNNDERYHMKETVVGVQINGESKAYPFSELSKATAPIIDQVGGLEIRVKYNAESQSAEICDRNDQPIASVRAFWFAWIAFHPDSKVYQAS